MSVCLNMNFFRLKIDDEAAAPFCGGKRLENYLKKRNLSEKIIWTFRCCKTVLLLLVSSHADSRPHMMTILLSNWLFLVCFTYFCSLLASCVFMMLCTMFIHYLNAAVLFINMSRFKLLFLLVSLYTKLAFRLLDTFKAFFCTTSIDRVKPFDMSAVRPDWAIFFCNLYNHSKPVAPIILPKLPKLLGIFCKGVKISHFSIEIIFGLLL